MSPAPRPPFLSPRATWLAVLVAISSAAVATAEAQPAPSTAPSQPPGASPPRAVVFSGSIGFGFGQFSSDADSESSGSFSLGVDVARRLSDHLALGGGASVDVLTPRNFLWIRITQFCASAQLRGGPVVITLGGGLALASSLRLIGSDEMTDTSIGVAGVATMIVPLVTVGKVRVGASAHLSASLTTDSAIVSGVVGAGIAL